MRGHIEQLLRNVGLADPELSVYIWELAVPPILQTGLFKIGKSSIRMPAFKLSLEAPVARRGKKAIHFVMHEKLPWALLVALNNCQYFRKPKPRAQEMARLFWNE